MVRQRHCEPCFRVAMVLYSEILRCIRADGRLVLLILRVSCQPYAIVTLGVLVLC